MIFQSDPKYATDSRGGYNLKRLRCPHVQEITDLATMLRRTFGPATVERQKVVCRRMNTDEYYTAAQRYNSSTDSSRHSLNLCTVGVDTATRSMPRPGYNQQRDWMPVVSTVTHTLTPTHTHTHTRIGKFAVTLETAGSCVHCVD